MSENHAETIKKLAILAEGSVFATNYGDRRFIIRPTGYTVEEKTLPHEMPVPQPKFIEQAAHLQTVASLIAYVARFKQEHQTVIFADLDRETMVAAIDYHKPVEGHLITAGLRRHYATLQLRKSEEWINWTKHNDEMWEQDEFAEFLTENEPDIIMPSGFDPIQDVVLDLSGSRIVRVARRMHRAHSGGGSKNVAVDETTTNLPPEINVVIPVYFDEPPVSIRTFLRDKLAGGEIELGYRMSRLEQVRQAELQRMVHQIGVVTGVPVFIGKI